jgi:short subunit dehydrogenase-like uncharacterized protein
MRDARWMLYGATGYTGQLVVEQAAAHGHRPLLAGRDDAKLRQLGRRYGFKYAAFPLDDVTTIARYTAEVELVYHAAGPFTYTADPMIRACLATHTHYLDITGEIHVFENTFRYDEVASKTGVALISGVGFDVIPSDCLAAYVAAQVPHARTLEIGVQALTQVSAGTARSLLEMLPQGAQVRRDGRIVSLPLGRGAKDIRYVNGTLRSLPIPWGDIATAYRTTRIPNITAYMPFPPRAIALASAGGAMAGVLRSAALRRLIGAALDRTITGPDAQARAAGRSNLYACASDEIGGSAEAWLETAEGYQFTALAAIPVIERTLAESPAGALTPALAFGADFVLEIEGTTRYDHLPHV